MLKHSVTFSDDTGAGLRGQLLDFLGINPVAIAPPFVPDDRDEAIAKMDDRIEDLKAALGRASVSLHEQSALINHLDKVSGCPESADLSEWIGTMAEGASVRFDLLERVAEAAGFPIEGDVIKTDALLDHVRTIAAELARRGERITMLEADVRRLGAQVVDNGEAPTEKAKRTRKKKDAEAPPAEVEAQAETQPEEKWPAGVSLAEYAVWEQRMKNLGTADSKDINPLEFKRLCDAGLVDRAELQARVAEASEPPMPYDLPAAEAVTPDGKWAKDLDPAKGEKRPAPHEPQFMVSGPKVNPSAPPEIQEATRIIHEFDQLPDPVLEEGAKVAVLMKEPTAIAVGHIEQAWPGATMFRVKLLTGLVDVFHRDRIRATGADEAPQDEEDAPAPETPAIEEPAMAGVGAGAPPNDDTFEIGDW